MDRPGDALLYAHATQDGAIDVLITGPRNKTPIRTLAGMLMVEEGFRIDPVWLVQVLASGLHNDLPNMLILWARRHGHLADCLGINVRRGLAHVNGSIYMHHELVVELRRMVCCRVDGRWVVQESSTVWEMDAA